MAKRHRVGGGKRFSAIKRRTNINDHTGALILGAKMLGMDAALKRLKHVEALQDIEGHLPQGLGAYRHQLYQEVMDHAQRSLSPEEFEEFHGSF
jgi:hypothetical protein